ncbi:hypothetical protein NDU88_003613 [Pleurodeles waltl]|uniref:Nuclease HARBI1 n=1 Tax=Pleurodeles waltl TaxID=8319 RepID=A0AAV7V133_PLEWA|nr:hypothetical protein NDU88_003613 [Pleurodeles waltl]
MAGIHRHLLQEPIGPNDNQCEVARRSSTAYRNSAQCQRNYLLSSCPSSQASTAEDEYEMETSSSVQTPGGPCDNEGQTHYPNLQIDRATIQELCAQQEPDLMSAIRKPTGISLLVQVLSVLIFQASGSFQTTVAMASRMSQPMFSNVLTRVLSALQKHMRIYILFPQVEDLATVKADFYALGHIPNIIDGTHVAFDPPLGNEQVFRNRKSYYSMNVQMLCLAD